MRLPAFEWQVAVRFLREGRFQTVLIVVGVAAGVAVIAYISALVSGLQANTLSKTLGSQPHVTIRAPEEVVTPALELPPGEQSLTDTQPRAQPLRSVANWQSVQRLLDPRPGIAVVSPLVSGAGLALRAEAIQGVNLSGVELDRYDRLAGLRDKVVAGTARLDPGDAIVGLALAHDLGLRPGDRFTIRTGAVSDTARATALVDFGARELNRRTVILPLRAAQNLLGLPGGVTSLDIGLDDVWSAPEVATSLRRQLPYRIESWQDTNAQLLSALNAQSISTVVIRLVVAAVVVLGIASVLVVSVVQKRREIGILRAMGATRGQVLRVFLIQGGLVGAIGSVLGLLLALAMIFLFTRFVHASDGGPLFPIDLSWATAMRVGLLALVCGVLAALAPARSAARLDPAQAIRL
ncbi:ABC transporter permease [Ramlibacter sp.]|uniref:ABC transporter permease n=1 Tax=Ramlibacter sp. TaxID=1917967 RepID=UPI002D5730B1|nr:FtsX-like permease family protein [Ramlibacter sp.]HYD75954.1 FtsX-like permease family protein [Ramlibacter sp.]